MQVGWGRGGKGWRGKDGLGGVVVPAAEAAEAYALLTEEGERRPVAILLSYEGIGPAAPAQQGIPLGRAKPSSTADAIRLAAVGAGSFATRMLFPHLARNRDVTLSWIVSDGGLTATHQGRRWRFQSAVPSLDQGLENGAT